MGHFIYYCSIWDGQQMHYLWGEEAKKVKGSEKIIRGKCNIGVYVAEKRVYVCTIFSPRFHNNDPNCAPQDPKDWHPQQYDLWLYCNAMQCNVMYGNAMCCSVM